MYKPGDVGKASANNVVTTYQRHNEILQKPPTPYWLF
jgi:hypothetical protein